MAIVIKNNDGFEALEPVEFENEKELELAIAENPALVRTDDDPAWALVSRQVFAARAGTLDILFVTSKGKPVVVEVKRLQNPESHEDVLTQAIRYSSALSAMTAGELDAAVSGKLKTAIVSLTSGNNESFDLCWQSCEKCLRAKQLTTVIALDDAPREELTDMVNYCKTLDVRLVSITKHRSKSGTVVLVPRMWVRGEEVQQAPRRIKHTGKGPVELAPEVQGIIAVYGSKDVKKSGRTWVAIVPSDWPIQDLRISYGAWYEDNAIGVSIDLTRLTRTEAKPLQELLKPLCPQLEKEFSVPVVWDDKWRHGLGCVTVRYPMETEPAKVGDTLRRLVERTSEDIKKELVKLASKQTS